MGIWTFISDKFFGYKGELSMYRILVYTGGVYRFNEIVELVEDNGGIVLKRDEFHISRGDYFISQEIHVIIVIPEEAFEELQNLTKELKGDLELIELEYEQKIAIISLIPVYNLLSLTETWRDADTLKGMIECPCLNDVCMEYDEISCFEDMEKTLDIMCKMEIAEDRIASGIREYRLKKD